MKILGLNTIGFNTSASLLVNGNLRCSIEEERLSRVKRTRQFPIKSISYILNKFNLKFDDLDAIAISWNPLINLEKFEFNQSENKSYIPNIIHSIPNYILKLTKEKSSEYFTQEIKLKKKTIKVYFINHHLSHASSYYFSGFKKASILTMDAFGEKQSAGMFVGNDKNIKNT